LVPGFVVQRADPDADAKALDRLAGGALSHSPVVETDPPNGIVMDTGACADFYCVSARCLDADRRRGHNSHVNKIKTLDLRVS
jgi:hypothetical protein